MAPCRIGRNRHGTRAFVPNVSHRGLDDARELPSSGGGRRARPRAGRPLRLEELAQAILSVAERNARDHRLQKTKDDVLAGIVRRQSGWSISRLGIATARALRDRFMPNSPRKLSVPIALFSIVMRPFMK